MGIIGKQQIGKSTFMRSSFGAKFKSSELEGQKTTNGIDIGVINKYWFSQILLDAEGYRGSETVAQFQSQISWIKDSKQKRKTARNLSQFSSVMQSLCLLKICDVLFVINKYDDDWLEFEDFLDASENFNQMNTSSPPTTVKLFTSKINNINGLRELIASPVLEANEIRFNTVFPNDNSLEPIQKILNDLKECISYKLAMKEQLERINIYDFNIVFWELRDASHNKNGYSLFKHQHQPKQGDFFQQCGSFFNELGFSFQIQFNQDLRRRQQDQIEHLKDLIENKLRKLNDTLKSLLQIFSLGIQKGLIQLFALQILEVVVIKINQKDLKVQYLDQQKALLFEKSNSLNQKQNENLTDQQLVIKQLIRQLKDFSNIFLADDLMEQLSPDKRDIYEKNKKEFFIKNPYDTDKEDFKQEQVYNQEQTFNSGQDKQVAKEQLIISTEESLKKYSKVLSNVIESYYKFQSEQDNNQRDLCTQQLNEAIENLKNRQDDIFNCLELLKSNIHNQQFV
ncbi:UNKNOWN [Stylonychia lemnae]|uniref:Uncharacterized protein n=1 Tax=Stylonychia lemnae TaxID=5949 RepID=A0A078B526_STYLE|nr:UNKNOWN [Stylonychia lemnae]|eukprot:CDW89346.1 UNKNOWN [Stylonychia lemnae]